LSEILSDIYNLSLSQISYEKFKKIDPQITDSGLIAKNQVAEHIIFYHSDCYCAFGFSDYLDFPITKYKLFVAWSKIYKNNTDAVWHYFNNNLKNSTKRQKIRQQEIIFELKKIYNKVIPVNFLELLNKNDRFALILPPNISNTKQDYSANFFRNVSKFNEQTKLELLVKPHRNDKKFYESLNHSKIQNELNLMKNIPVEFLFHLPQVKSIYATPSASLSCAEKKLLHVFVPKKRNLYRKNFLDQEIFLDYINQTFLKI
jgi:hypothetical protein